MRNYLVSALLFFNLLAIIFIFSEYLCINLNGNNTSTLTVSNQEIKRLIEVQACSNNMVCYDVLLAIGPIDESMVNQILSSITKKNNKPICFLSQGGNSASAIRISKAIREYHISTCLADKYVLKGKQVLMSSQDSKAYCQSACVFVLMSSNTRISIGSKATVGIHAPARKLEFCICDIPVTSFGIDDSEILDLIENTQDIKHKVNFYSLYVKSLQIPNKEMYQLNSSELNDFGVFNEFR